MDHKQSGHDGTALPTFEVLLTRKFEITELCGIFMGRVAKYAYLFLNTASNFLYLLAFATVAGSAWAVNLPLSLDGIAQCNNSQFHFHILPTDIACRNAYWFSLFLFSCIVVPLSVIDLREQAIVQVMLSIFRLITVGAILIFCVANLIAVGNICTCKQPWQNATEADDSECNINTTFSQMTTHFDVEAWTVIIPVIVSAIALQTGLPFMTHPVKQKKHLGTLLIVVYLVMTSIYMMLGVVVPMWWKECIDETCSLNWVSITTIIVN